MKVTHQLRKDLTVELDVKDTKDLFTQLASLHEVIRHETCGKCQKTNTAFQVRVIDDNSFYEIKCLDCGATLSFGCHKKGNTLFPKYKDDDGKWLPSGGWLKYNPATQKKE